MDVTENIVRKQSTSEQELLDKINSTIVSAKSWMFVPRLVNTRMEKNKDAGTWMAQYYLSTENNAKVMIIVCYLFCYSSIDFLSWIWLN